MPLKIIDLLEEILDPIIGALFLGCGPNGLVLNTRAYEHCCRLVCQRLFLPVLRWLCRRVHLKLCRFDQHVRVTGSPFARPEYARVLNIASSTGCGILSPANTPLFSRMGNLRILIVQLSPTLVAEIPPHVLPLPMLHAVVLEGSEATTAPTDWSWLWWSFHKLKKLDFKCISNIGPLISLSLSLEALSVRPAARLDEVLSSIVAHIAPAEARECLGN